MLTRRDALKNLALGAGAGLAGSLVGHGPALAQSGRVLTVNIPGNSLGVHIPYMAAMNEMLPGMKGYAVPDIKRVNSLRIITQSILSGSTEIGAGDAITTLRAVQAGADMKIVGHAFVHTSLVFVVNGDKVKDWKDFENSDNKFAVNSLGDFTYAMFAGPLLQKGVDLKKVNAFEIGGSGARMRALLAGKVDGVPLHFDQAADLAKKGNFKVMIEPAKVYDVFLGEVWIVGSEWLKKPENGQAVTDLMKATITAFRRTHENAAWYHEMYGKYGTKKNMKEQSLEEVDVVRKALGVDIGCWPKNMNFTKEAFAELVPLYQDLEILKGDVDIDKAVDTSYVEKALDELGRA